MKLAYLIIFLQNIFLFTFLTQKQLAAVVAQKKLTGCGTRPLAAANFTCISKKNVCFLKISLHKVQ